MDQENFTSGTVSFRAITLDLRLRYCPWHFAEQAVKTK